MGYPPPPPSRPGWGIPPPQTWDGVPPHHPDMDMDRVPPQTWDGVPPTIQTWMGYPPEMLTDRHLWKQYLPVIQRMRAVTRKSPAWNSSGIPPALYPVHGISCRGRGYSVLAREVGTLSWFWLEGEGGTPVLRPDLGAPPKPGPGQAPLLGKDLGPGTSDQGNPPPPFTDRHL